MTTRVPTSMQAAPISVTIGQVGGENSITVGAGQTFTFTPSA